MAAAAAPTDLKAQVTRETRGMHPEEKARYLLAHHAVSVKFVRGGKVVASPTGRMHYIQDTPNGERCDCPSRIQCWAQFAVAIIAARYDHDDPFPWVS